jgi:choice-of-anchor B domain-containing protein
MKFKLRHVVLPLFLFTVLFHTDVFAIWLEGKIPDRSQKIEPGVPMAATPCIGGMAGPYPCSNIDLLAFLPLSSIGCTSSGNVVEGWLDPLTNKEYALMGCDNGVSFVDVTDPVNPVYVGRLPAHNNSNSLWRDIRVYTKGGVHRMYVGSEASGHGIQVFNLIRLRGVSGPPVIFTENSHYNGLGNSHTIFLNNNTGFLFAVGTQESCGSCCQGLHMIDVKGPTKSSNHVPKPKFAGCFGNNTYTHEVTCLTYTGPDTTYDGHEICFAANGDFGNNDRLVIADVSNKSASQQLSSTPYAGAGYCHQVWLTEDQQFLLMDDEFDESDFNVNTTTLIWDITDLNAPVMIDKFVHQTTSIDHNQYVKGNYVYQSNYSSGLRILDLTNVSTGDLTEVAYFDVYPVNDVKDFEGTWDNYPYLPSGIVLVSGLFGGQTGGLFILQPNITADFHIASQDELLNACGTGSASTTIDVMPLAEYSGNVTLSANGLPSGATASFVPNPVSVPGTSTMTIDLSATPPGNYPFDVQGTDGAILHTSPLTSNVATSLLPPPALLHPEDNAIDQGFIVHYEWDPLPDASGYDLEVAKDAQFTNVIYTASTSEDHHTGFLTLDPSTQYWWHIRTNNACGPSAWSGAFTFTTAAPANILLVDDDDKDPEVLSYYEDAINFAGQTFDVWDTTTQGLNGTNHVDEPGPGTMSNYKMVIWFSGDAKGGSDQPKAGPNDSSEAALTQYLGIGGCLLLTSEEYFSDQGGVLDTFQANILGASSITDNANHTTVTGNGIFSDVGSLTLDFSWGLTNASDVVNPDAVLGSQLAFTGDMGNAGISRDTSGFRSIFLGFPLEAISDQAKRREVIQKAIDFCITAPQCLFCDDFEDGVLDSNWTYIKEAWSEDGDSLIGTPAGKTAIAIASPAFGGCGSNCTVKTTMSNAGGSNNRAILLAWYVDKKNTVELLMKQETGTWILKQKSNGKVVAKQKALLPINPNQFYDVQLSYDGTQFQVSLDGTVAITMPSAAAVPVGTVGYQVKNTTASFGSINVN